MSENKRSLLLDTAAAVAGSYTVDLSVADQGSIIVWWTLANATAAADLTAASCIVKAYDPSGTVVLNTTLAEETTIASGAFTSPIAATAKRYDVRGISKLRIFFTTTATRHTKVYVNSYWG